MLFHVALGELERGGDRVLEGLRAGCVKGMLAADGFEGCEDTGWPVAYSACAVEGQACILVL